MVIPDPKAGRFDGAARWLQAAAVAAAVLAALALAAPDRVGSILGVLAIGLVVGVPIIRLAWLGLRWLRRGDTRFAGLPPLIIVVIGVGLLVGLT